MNWKFGLLGPVLFLLLLCSGCVVGKKRYEAAVEDGKQLETRLSELNMTKDKLRGQLSRARSELAEKKRLLDEAYRKLANSVAEAGALKEDVSEMKVALDELESRKARIEASLQAYRDLVSRFQSLINAGTLRVKVVDGRMVVEMATDILFSPGKAALSRDGRTALAEVAGVLSGIEGRVYQIAGHTDNVPIRSTRFPSNWHLGAARAIAVASLLVESGLDAHRVSASSYAETRPADTNRTKEGRARNRRIEIIVVPDLSELPGYDELQRLSHDG